MWWRSLLCFVGPRAVLEGVYGLDLGGGLAVGRLAAAPSVPAAVDVVRSTVCACMWLCQAFILKMREWLLKIKYF